MQPVEKIPPFRRRAQRQHRAAVAIPRAHQRLAEALTIALRRHHGVGTPGPVNLEPFQRYADGKRRVMANDGRAFARHPDLRLAGGVVGIAAMLPVPAQTRGIRRVGALHAAIQQFDTTTIFRTVSIDL